MNQKNNPGLLRVFVYGTLKPGEENYERYCGEKVTSATIAMTMGKLFDLTPGYPGMTSGDSPVWGYFLEFADGEVLTLLDELEDYQPTRQKSENLYNRQELEIYDQQGLSLGKAWVYLMTQELVNQLGGIHLPNGWWDKRAAEPTLKNMN
ncbi:MAG: gamma-glutamylcyclotransferase [Calothrix sp. SM1_7_51]|nr:gamma-glutamylcyclotransferase [Calothrix sp. SM1_7_51]